MGAVKKRINSFAVFAVLAAGNILLTSAAPKSTKAAERINPFIKYDEMYNTYLEVAKKSPLDELPQRDIEVLNENMDVELGDYTEKLKEAKNDLITHLKCIYWYLRKDDEKKLDKDVLLVAVYFQFLTFYFCHRVFMTRETKISEGIVSAEDRKKLHEDDVTLLLKFLMMYATNTPNEDILDALKELGAINDDQAYEIEKSMSQLRGINFDEDTDELVPKIVPLESIPNLNVNNSRLSLKKLKIFFKKMLPDSYIPPSPFADAKEEYHQLRKFQELKVMDISVGENESRLNKVIQALVQITDGPKDTDDEADDSENGTDAPENKAGTPTDKDNTPREKVDAPQDKTDDAPKDKIDIPKEKADLPKEKADAPECKTDPPKDKADTPEDEADTLKEKTDTAKDIVDTPEDKADPPKEKAGDASKDKIDIPKEKADAPKEKADTPESKTDPPKDKVDTPEDEADTLKEKTDAAKDKSDTPEDKAEAPKDKVGTPAKTE